MVIVTGRFAALERLQIAGIRGTPPAESSFRSAADPSGRVKRLLTVVTDPRRLRETAHGLLRFPVALLSSHLCPDELAPAVQVPSRSWS